ncbi:hypothetical protein [Spiroplasma tabanidicola]|uniref:Uncharacterized protein n=1 Tax=Spiroplasma tabanidicola TaxID=324079 RepID=A0A6I6CAF6_9MOLU|nr:hypothetical protein [Spiroplasma tabanidicola]QGS51901.1 hypothetical protein STABA_v1c05380 [Spiroplasma tabanidicola]
MISYFKCFKINEDNVTDLKDLNPFWKSKVNKIIKRLKVWLIKFNKSDVGFEINTSKLIDDYPELFQNINNFKNFFNQKYKIIKVDIKLLKKFEKMIVQYCQLLGIINSIETMCIYFSNLKILEVKNRKEYALKLANDNILRFYNIFQNELKNIYKDDKYLELIWSDFIIPKSSIINLNKVLILTFQYTKKLSKKKKLNKENYTIVSKNTTEFYSFINGYSEIITRFIQNLI